MILFYNKKTGEIFGKINGFTHTKEQMNCSINNGLPEKQVGKFIIGLEETDERYIEEIDIEKFVELPNGLYEKVIEKQKIEKTKNKEHNLDQKDIIDKIENSNFGEYKLNLKTKKVIFNK